MQITHDPPAAVSLERCPHLGLHDDPDTSLAYPSIWNCCYRAAPSTSVLVSHQAETCLRPSYIHCPVYLARESMPLPSNLRGRVRAKVRKRGPAGWLKRGILFLLLATGVTLVVFLGRSAFTGRAGILPFVPMMDQSETVAGASTRLSTAEGRQVPASEAVTESPVPDPTPSAAVRSTLAASPADPPPGACGHLLDIPFGGEAQFVLHRVRSGENLTMFADRYHTTISAILAVNHRLRAPVWEDWIVVIPVEMADVGEYPPFEPYQVPGTMLSLDELPAELKADPQSLLQYNGFEQPCTSFSGWLLIPREAPGS